MDSWLPLANVTVLKVVHPQNATGVIVIIEAGTKTLPVVASGTIKHCLTPVLANASFPMLWSWLPLAKVTLVSLEVHAKTNCPILVTEAGISMLVKPDPENA